MASVTPDIFSSAQSLFGSSFPAGNYKVKYRTGSVDFFSGGNQWFVNYITGPYDSYYNIAYNNGSNTIAFTGGSTPDSTAYASPALCEAEYSGASVSFTHTGGAIGMWLIDSFYYDNTSAPPSPTFDLYRSYP